MKKPKFIETSKLPETDEKAACQHTRDQVREWIAEQCGTHGHANSMEHCDAGKDPCPCTHDDVSEVDLIVLIDSSGSMNRAADAIGKAAQTAIQNAQKNCKADGLEVQYFTVDNSNNGVGNVPANFASTFTHTHQEWLVANGAPGPFQQDDPGGDTGEEGADAITDLANFYPWRENACRAIFYVSDTALDGNSANTPTQQAAVTRAIAACLAKDVTVFAHFVDPKEPQTGSSLAVATQGYVDLTTQTGGIAEIGGTATVKLYEKLLEGAVCNSCGICEPFEWPDLKPCVSIKWGQSKCDGMESHDDEVLCITVCNCYQNVTFKNLSIGYIWLVDEKGNTPPTLPDGNPSARVYPVGPICFGDILPCNEEGAQCVTQEAIVLMRNAKPGKYKVMIGDICFGVEHHYRVEEQALCFEVCQD